MIYKFVHTLKIQIPKIGAIFVQLDEKIAPNTVRLIMQNLPFTTKLHIWGQEIYSDPIPVTIPEENSKDTVDLYDVAFWPPGNAICLFFGPTPSSTQNQIKPYSAVNVIGKIKDPDMGILQKIHDGTKAAFIVA